MRALHRPQPRSGRRTRGFDKGYGATTSPQQVRKLRTRRPPRDRQSTGLRQVRRFLGSGKRQPRQRRKRSGAGFLHDGCAVGLDRALADAEIGGGVLAGVAGEDQVHDLPLSRRESGNMVRRRLPPGKQLARISRLLERAFDAGAQFAAIERLLDEIQRARLHGLHRHGHVAVAGDHDGRQAMVRTAYMLQQFETAHSRQICIDHQTSLATRAIDFEEGLAGREILDGASVDLERLAESVAQMTVVVDDKDDLPEIVGRLRGEPDWRKLPFGSRRRQKALDGLGQLLQPHRLVELDAVVTGNVAQRARRYVTGQDDNGDPAMKSRAQLLDNLKPILTLRQIVIREDEIGPDLASRDQIERGDPVRCDSGMAALVLEQQIEEIAHLGIVLDDQNSARAMHPFCDRIVDFRPAVFHPYGDRTRWGHDVDCKNRTLAQLRADMHTMAEQIAQALYDRKPEAEAPATLARGVVELMVFVEDPLEFFAGDADAGIPDLDAQRVVATAAAEQYLSARGVFQCVRKQVAHHLLKQTRIAVNR